MKMTEILDLISFICFANPMDPTKEVQVELWGPGPGHDFLIRYVRKKVHSVANFFQFIKTTYLFHNKGPGSDFGFRARNFVSGP